MENLNNFYIKPQFEFGVKIFPDRKPYKKRIKFSKRKRQDKKFSKDPKNYIIINPNLALFAIPV